MRIIAPADKTFVNYADDNHYYLDFADVPAAKGVDISYPKNVKIAQDFFFYIPDRDPKWIAAVDEEGVGMMQCSTRELLGRKLFVWGDSHGGDNWKNFLSDGSNDGYVAIQAGLARTRLDQLEEACKYLNHELLVPDIKEDENLITQAWFALYGAILSRKTGVTDPARLHQLVEQEYPLGGLDFRMH